MHESRKLVDTANKWGVDALLPGMSGGDEMNKTKPILFSTEMVNAILDGRKSMTRRVIKDKDITNNFDIDVDGSAYAYINPETGDSYPPTAIAKYQVGDILWVRETWSKDENGEYVYRTNYGTTEDDSFPPSMFKWKSSIHMPREAARIFLRVKNVRVERVQDITEEDAKNEGVKDPYDYQEPSYYDQPHVRGMEINKSAFAGLWDSIYAEPKAVTNKDDGILYYVSYPWEDIQETREYKGKPWYVYGNPWVWVYEFERVEGE